ncbi:L-type lectin family protein [Bombilactobacillus thymidiniphilus]|uniref:Repeat protein (TIGR01451 family) n=1 Tax=Bombilactobacillus thymidiniphilus TaxID=2923363 RepID=A0ABY4PBK5_9LACO|nr:hypothetical protein [Bombilactobacillus thymidiniphilus]UQS83158.1 hypothetical protein MOO47_05060 [Bombilactobacillus thymidiniphilus]
MKNKLRSVFSILKMFSTLFILGVFTAVKASAATTPTLDLTNPPTSLNATNAINNDTFNILGGNLGSSSQTIIPGHPETQKMASGENDASKAMWNKTPINIHKPFCISFYYYMNGKDTTHTGDGLTFTMQNSGNQLLGSAGEAIGIYGSLRNSSSYTKPYDGGLTVEFDPKYNENTSDSDLALDTGDAVKVNRSHVAITDGTTRMSNGHYAINHWNKFYDAKMVSNAWKHVTVQWDPNNLTNKGTLTVFQEDDAVFPETNVPDNYSQKISYVEDLSDYDSNKPVYWGFTSATGNQTMNAAVALDYVKTAPTGSTSLPGQDTSTNPTTPTVVSGPSITKTVHNFTKDPNSEYTNTVDANPGDIVEYKVTINNSTAHGIGCPWYDVQYHDVLPTGMSSATDGKNTFDKYVGNVGLDTGSVSFFYRATIDKNTKNQLLQSQSDKLTGKNWPGDGMIARPQSEPIVNVKSNDKDPVITTKVKNLTTGADKYTKNTDATQGDTLQYEVSIDNSDGVKDSWNDVKFTDDLAKGLASPLDDSNEIKFDFEKNISNSLSLTKKTYKVKVNKDAPVGLAQGKTTFSSSNYKTVTVDDPIINIKSRDQNPSIKIKVKNITAGDTKFSKNTNATQGDKLKYKVVIDNSKGVNGSWNDVKLTDTLPDGLSSPLNESNSIQFVFDKNITNSTTPTKTTYNVKVNDDAPIGIAQGTTVFKSSNYKNVKVSDPTINIQSSDHEPSIVKTVRNTTDDPNAPFTKTATAKPGDTLEYKVAVDNSNGIKNWNTVNLIDTLPGTWKSPLDGSNTITLQLDNPSNNHLTPTNPLTYKVKVGKTPLGEVQSSTTITSPNHKDIKVNNEPVITVSEATSPVATETVKNITNGDTDYSSYTQARQR